MFRNIDTASADTHEWHPDLKKLASGDELAFKQFFEVYEYRLYTYIFKIVKSREIAEELVIDIFVKIWSNREFFQDVQSIDKFLYRMAVNKALDFLRAAAREKKIRVLLAKQLEIQQKQSMATPYDLKENEHHVQQYLLRLTRQQKLIFHLSREEGLSHDEIARELNLSKNTVKNHLVTALKSLRDFLKRGQLLLFLF